MHAMAITMLFTATASGCDGALADKLHSYLLKHLLLPLFRPDLILQQTRPAGLRDLLLILDDLAIPSDFLLDVLSHLDVCYPSYER